MNLFNQAIALLLPFVPKPIVRKVSDRYIAGVTLDDAVRTVRALNAKGAMATVDVLGEFIQTLTQAEENTRYSCEVLRRLHSDKLQGNLSIKLTSLGLGLDNAACERNVRAILEVARSNGNTFVRIDMENSPYTELTLGLYRTFRREGFNVGVVLQAYMRRTAADIDQLVAEGKQEGIETKIRLCKGIYIESVDIAYKGRKEIQDNYLMCLDKLFTGGAYVGIASHDDVLIKGAKDLIRRHGLKREEYEFQMLLGVREPVRDALIAEGHRLRVYVPFGEDWYGYSIRRLKENPSIGGYIVKALLTGK
jgi:proline dehydrogenase